MKIIPGVWDFEDKVKQIIEEVKANGHDLDLNEILDMKYHENDRWLECRFDLTYDRILFYKEFFSSSTATIEIYNDFSDDYSRLSIKSVNVLGKQYKSKNIFHSHYRELYDYLFDLLVENRIISKRYKNIFRMIKIDTKEHLCTNFYGSLLNIGSFKYSEYDRYALVSIYDDRGNPIGLQDKIIPNFHLVDKINNYRNRGSINKKIDFKEAIKKYAKSIGFSDNPLVIFSDREYKAEYYIVIPEYRDLSKILTAVAFPDSGKIEVAAANMDDVVTLDMKESDVYDKYGLSD